jgi:hypothetical protein
MNSFLERLENLNLERQRYTLETLVSHLTKAGQYDRLRSLFDDELWMHARFEGSGFVYDGYISDVNIVWRDVAHPQALRQIEMGEEPTALAGCLRYALIRTSINSLSATYVPELIMRAVELGMWQPTRALSVAARISRAEKKFRMYALLLSTNTMNEEQHVDTLKAALTASLAMRWTSDCVQALVQLIPYFPADQRQNVIQIAFDKAVTIVTESSRAYALVTLAPYLTSSQLQMVLDIVLAMRYESDRVGPLNELVPYLSFDQRQEVLQTVLDATLATCDGFTRDYTLRTFAPQLAEFQPEVALDIALAISDSFDRVSAYVQILPHLPFEQRQKALQMALEPHSTIIDERNAVHALVLQP